MSSTTRLRRSLLALLSVSALIGNASVARSQTVLTNSPERPDLSAESYSFGPKFLASGFMLSDGPWDLSDITVIMTARTLNGASPTTIDGSLWSDNGSGKPGSQIAALSLTGSTLGLIPSPLTYSATGTVTLTAGTQYWFVARAGEPGSFSAKIGMGNDGAHGVNNTGYHFRFDGTEWTEGVSLPLAMTVRGIRPTGGTNGGGGGAVPEPSEWAAMGVLGMALGGLALRKRRTA